MEMGNLGKRQKEIYEFIKLYFDKHSIPPTVREIAEAVSLKSTSTVHLHLKELQKRGLISMEPMKQRSITIMRSEGSRGVLTPLIGDVAAGQPILAYDNIQETFTLPSSLLHGANETEVFMLKVEGESMIDIGILNGDLIVVHNAIGSENGDIVVARVGGDTATVKRIYYEKAGVRLQPENSNMDPIYASYDDVEIVGKVIGLIRRY
ncbi:MAG: transcriptional repressor LexA [Candidatus Gastranaerophilaceae bacterium]|jgi:repressor LexA|nr:transcriptional repressor LexA [Christensenellales bacterium]